MDRAQAVTARSSTPPQPDHSAQGKRPPGGLRARLHEIIFEADTPAGRLFDLLLLLAIVSSVVVVLLESVASVRARAGPTLHALEWGFTVLFTIEYLLRLASVGRPLRYARSTLGVIDLLAILPSYISLVFPGGQSLLVIRLLRCCGCSGCSSCPSTCGSRGRWCRPCEPAGGKSPSS